MIISNPDSKRIRIQTKVFMAKINTKFGLTLNIFFSPKIALGHLGGTFSKSLQPYRELFKHEISSFFLISWIVMSCLGPDPDKLIHFTPDPDPNTVLI
jgi:hypothetical protein